MRFVLQRVSRGAVVIDGGETRSIGPGLVVLAGVCAGDDERVCAFMADKLACLRIFGDRDGNLNRSLLDVGGECLLISNFTLYASCKKGRRPSFIDAAPPALARQIYNQLTQAVSDAVAGRLQTGEFGAHMDIDMLCDGPVTILLDSAELMKNK